MCLGFLFLLDEEKRNSPMKTVIIQNRIMLLIERFFTRLYLKMATLTAETSIKEIAGPRPQAVNKRTVER